MKTTKIICAVLISGIAIGANATQYCESYTSGTYGGCNATYQDGDTTGCSEFKFICYYSPVNGDWSAAVNCTKCSTGYTLKTGNGARGCSDTIKYAKCEQSSGGADTWQTCSYANLNIELRVVNGNTFYRCKAGYYYYPEYAPTSCTSSCIKCPNNGTSNPDDNAGISKCYQTAGTHSDSTGLYQLTGTCYYKE